MWAAGRITRTAAMGVAAAGIAVAGRPAIASAGAGGVVPWTVTMAPGGQIWVGGADGGGIPAAVSQDGGQSWMQPCVPSALYGVNSIWFADTRHGWMAGLDYAGGGQLARTDDAGAHWTLLTLPAGTSALGSAAFANTQVGFAAATLTPSGGAAQTTTALLATADGGSTWRVSSFAHESLRRVFALDAVHAWAAGSDGGGDIRATVDSGGTWTRQTVPAGIKGLEAIDFVDTQHGWATGAAEVGSAPPQAVVIATTDGGSTWKQQAIPGDLAPLWGVSFVDASTGWVVGQHQGDGAARILSTVDGGATWVEQALPTTPLLAVSFADRMHGAAVDQRYAWTTVDGGATWRRAAETATVANCAPPTPVATPAATATSSATVTATPSPAATTAPPEAFAPTSPPDAASPQPSASPSPTATASALALNVQGSTGGGGGGLGPWLMGFGAAAVLGLGAGGLVLLLRGGRLHRRSRRSHLPLPR